MKNNHISLNIKYLVNKEKLGKDAFGKVFGLNRGAIGSYIDGKAYPKIDTLQKISEKYNILIDDIINKDLSQKTNEYLNNIVKEPQDIYEKEKTIEDIISNKVIEKLKPYLEKIELQDAALAEMVIKMGMIEEKVNH